MTSYAHALAAQRNQQMARDDVAWAVGPNGDLYLRDKPSWTAAHTRELDRKAQSEREEWKRHNA